MAKGDLVVGKIPGRVNSHITLDRGTEGHQVLARFLSDETEQVFLKWLRKYSTVLVKEESDGGN